MTPPSTASGHRTSDLWEAAYLWAQGFPLIDTESQGNDRVFFCFPDGGDELEEAVRAYGLGTALVNPTAHRQGYYQMRDAMSRELGDASTG